MHADDMYPRFMPLTDAHREWQLSTLTSRAEKADAAGCIPVETYHTRNAEESPYRQKSLIARFGLYSSSYTTLEHLYLLGQHDELIYQTIRYMRASTLEEITHVEQEILDLFQHYVVLPEAKDCNVQYETEFPIVYAKIFNKKRRMEQERELPPYPEDFIDPFARVGSKTRDPAKIGVELEPPTERAQAIFALWTTLPVRFRLRYSSLSPDWEHWHHLREGLITTSSAADARAVAGQCIAQLYGYREQVAQSQWVDDNISSSFRLLANLAQWRATQLG